MTLKNYRKRAELTQQELADRSGIDIRRIQRLESGEIQIKNITLETAYNLAEALYTDAENLLKGEPVMNLLRITSNSTYERQYEVSGSDILDLAQEYGRAEGGEHLRLVDEDGETIAAAIWSLEGHEYIEVNP